MYTNNLSILTKKYELKKDQYRKARGGRSKLLILICVSCKNQLLIYQKDGPGILKRLYFDRIFSPPQLVALQNQFDVSEMNKIDNLTCPHCKKLIGFAKLYEKENRLSFHLVPGSFSKKIYKPISTNK